LKILLSRSRLLPRSTDISLLFFLFSCICISLPISGLWCSGNRERVGFVVPSYRRSGHG
jgi:hypothetical protein